MRSFSIGLEYGAFAHVAGLCIKWLLARFEKFDIAINFGLGTHACTRTDRTKRHLTFMSILVNADTRSQDQRCHVVA